MAVFSKTGKKEKSDKGVRAGVALVGNMNVGKSTLFAKMCNTKTEGMNIPGNTVAVKSGIIKGTNRYAFDTPGICSIFSDSEDERASRSILLPGENDYLVDGILLVADAKKMKRSVAIALQYAEYGLPMLMDINMIDEASPRGIEIDTEKLSRILNVHVSTTIAREGIGVSRLVNRLSDMRIPERLVDYPEWVEDYLRIVSKLIGHSDISPRAIGLLLLADDRDVSSFLLNKYGSGMLAQLEELADEYRKQEPVECSLLFTDIYNKKANQIVDLVQVVTPPPKSPMLARFGDWCTQLSTGLPIAALILWLVYLFVGSFGATFLVDAINTNVFEGIVIPFCEKLVAPIPSEFIRDMIVDPDFGVLPTGVFLALGLVVPVLFCFYIAFGILEESGYLPRISILLDRVLKWMGLNGKGVIPLVMGFSCVTMALLTTRLLDTEKEKNIASFLLFLTMPCAPLIAVMLVILDKMPTSASITVFGIIFSQILVAGILVNKLLPGTSSLLFMEIPSMRIPKPSHILRKATSKTFHFIKEALPVFIAASLMVFVFQRLGGLAWIEETSGPILGKVMGLPEKSIQVFIKTMIRRESGAADLQHFSYAYTNVQIVVNLLVMTFIAPCLNAVIVLYKERGMKAATLILISVTIYAIVVGSIVNHTCRFFGVTFT